MGDENCPDFSAGKGFDVEEVWALPDLSFGSRNLDTGGELRRKIRIQFPLTYTRIAS